MFVPINPEAEYKPHEIAERGYIMNTKGKKSYRYILELIRAGKLRARNVGNETSKYFKVLGADIITWKKGTYTIPEQKPHERDPHKHRPFPQSPELA